MSKRVQADWKLVLGEVALDIRPGRIMQGLQGGGEGEEARDIRPGRITGHAG